MRKGYWIIFVFAAWCIISALWYMFSVKGLPANTGLIKPAPTAFAIIEIMVMITIAALLGFGLAWMMRADPIEVMTDELRNSRYAIKELERMISAGKEAIDISEQEAADAQLASDQLNLQLAEAASLEEQLKQKNADLEGKIQSMNGELSSLKFRLRVTESEVADKNKAIGALTQELDDAGKPKVEHREWSDHPFVRPVDTNSAGTDEKDDLTEIKGIGPAFQKKLNLLDIYSFRQISELDGESVERLAELIEVFPDRIHRDNWIGQATRLYMRKLGREEP